MDSSNATREFALAAADLAANTRCENVVLLDLRGRSPVAEYFLIATGTSPRQMRTVADEIGELGKKMGFPAWKMAGYDSASWIVLDCVSVVTHVLDGQSREHYDLELLWGEENSRVDWARELGRPPVAVAAEREDLREADAPGGDADIDESAETDALVMTELAEEEDEGVELVEIDPPAKRGRPGKTIFPVHVEQEDELESAVHLVDPMPAAEAEQELEGEIKRPAKKRPAKKRAAKKKAAKKRTTRKAPAKTSGKSPRKLAPRKKPARKSKKKPLAPRKKSAKKPTKKLTVKKKRTGK